MSAGLEDWRIFIHEGARRRRRAQALSRKRERYRNLPTKLIAGMCRTMIRQLNSADVLAYRDIRLEALRLCPSAFGSCFDEEQHLTAAEFTRRVAPEPPDAVFGAFPGDTALVGIAGFRAHRKAKERHKSTLVGMYVRPDARGRGIAGALVRRVIAHARDTSGIELLQLTVTVDNALARALYDRFGFIPYGIEPRALCLAPGDYRDEELRALDLTAWPITSA